MAQSLPIFMNKVHQTEENSLPNFKSQLQSLKKQITVTTNAFSKASLSVNLELKTKKIQKMKFSVKQFCPRRYHLTGL